MKNVLKGAAVTVIVLIILIIVQTFCNWKGIPLDFTAGGTVSAICAMLVYHGLTRKEKE